MMGTDKPRFSLTMGDETFSRVCEFQKEKGFSTKSRAIQFLVETSLKELEKTGTLPEPETQDQIDFMGFVSTLKPDQKEIVFSLLALMNEQNQRDKPADPSEAGETDQE